MAKKVLNFATFGLLSFVPGKIGKVLRGAVLVAAGFLTGQPGFIAAGLGMIGGAFAGKPKVSPNTIDRLTASMVPDTARKIVFAITAMATDVRYQGFTGDDQEYVHWIMAVAAHECHSVDEIWFDTKKAWDSGSGVTSDYTGYLTIDTRNPGTNANGIAIDAVWTSTCTLTGCCYLHLRFKTTGNSKKAESPFASALPSRVTVRGRGALLPDVREGGCDAGDQTTWDWFDDDSGRNPALQLLFYLIGWRIGGKLSVGRGIPVNRLDLDSFITAANFCDEPVTLAIGGTEPRYRSDGVFSEGDDPGLVIGNLTGAMNAVLRDDGGRLSVVCLHNNLSTPTAAFTEADILGDESWEQTAAVDEYFNVIRGRYTDPSDAGLYQLVDYPEIEVDSLDGIERADSFDLPTVQSASQAQRLAKGRLERNLYRGVYSAKFNERAWQVSLGDIVTLSHISLGWDEKLFRVIGHGIALTGIVTMALQEEHEDIYAWDADESPAVVAAVPTAYDPLNNPLLLGMQDIELVIDGLLDASEAAAEDQNLSADEKLRIIIPAVEALDARYDYLTARATAAGVSTTAAGAARTAFVTDYLEVLSPAWNDTTQDSPLVISAFDDFDFPTGWTLTSASVLANGRYTTVTDASTTDYGAVHRQTTAGAGLTYIAELVVKKDAVGAATRNAGLSLQSTVGTLTSGAISFDTSTGAVSAVYGSPVDYDVVELNDEEWGVTVQLAMGVGNTGIRMDFYPALSVGAGFPAVTTTGSVDFRDPLLHFVGFLPNGGRAGFQYLQRAYAAALDALAKAISEVDGVTSLQIDGPKIINVPATSDGDPSAALPINRQYFARAGAGVVTADDWDVTVLTGTATLSIASDGLMTVEDDPLTPTVTARIDATYGAAEQSYTFQINRVDAPASGGGGGGSGGTTTAYVSDSVSSTSFVTIATVTQTVGSAGPVLSSTDLVLEPVDIGGGDGTWNVEFKWVRENGVTDVDVGSTANSSPDPAISGGVSNTGYAACSATDSGRTVSVSYTYYLQARLSSGSQPIYVSGTARVTS